MHFVFRFTSCFGVRSQGLSFNDRIQITTEIYNLQEVKYRVVSFFFFLQVTENQLHKSRESRKCLKTLVARGYYFNHNP